MKSPAHSRLELGKAIRSIRLRAGMSQAEFARLVFGDASNANLSRYERGIVMPEPSRLLLLNGATIKKTSAEGSAIYRAIEIVSDLPSLYSLSAPPQNNCDEEIQLTQLSRPDQTSSGDRVPKETCHTAEGKSMGMSEHAVTGLSHKSLRTGRRGNALGCEVTSGARGEQRHKRASINEARKLKAHRKGHRREQA